MPEVDGVWYSEGALELMQQLSLRARPTLDGELDPAIVAEMRTIEALHDEFPGCVLREPDQPRVEPPDAPPSRSRAGSQRSAVLEALREVGEQGATDYELWANHGIGARPHVAATRRAELIETGWQITDSGRRRETDTGTAAIVWVMET